MPRAVVFDLDGVLVDSEREWDAARRELVEATSGYWLPDATTDMLGMSAPEWSAYMRERLDVPLPADEINRRVVARILARYRAGPPLMPGAVDVVKRLASEWPLGLATSSNRPVIDALLNSTGMVALFAATVSSEEVARGKPAPDVYLAAARALEVDPSDATAIEDSANGLRSASAAGMSVIAVPNRTFPPSEDALALADLTLGSLEKLDPDAVRRAAGRRAG